jgi:HSP20 family protein
VLCIQGERRQEREEKRKGHYRSERSYGRFYREVPLPEGTDPEQASASFKNGVLEVTMPAPPPAAKGKPVPITES